MSSNTTAAVGGMKILSTLAILTEQSSYTGTTNGSEEILYCQKDTRIFRTVELVVAVISVICHFFICAAFAFHGKNLRQNLVNIYAVNLIVANFLSAVSRVFSNWSKHFEDIQVPFPDDRYNNQTGLALQFTWLFSNVVVLILFLVVTAGISLVIMSLRDNLFRIHEMVAGLRRPSNVFGEQSSTGCVSRYKQWLRNNPRTYATCLIVMSWCLPILIALLSASTGGCIRKCDCVFDYVPSDQRPACPTSQGCHMFWTPMTNRVVIVQVSIWMLFVLILIYFLVRSLIDLRHLTAKRATAVSSYKNSKETHFGNSMFSESEQDPNKIQLEHTEPNNPNSLPGLISTDSATCSDDSGLGAETSSIFLKSVKKNIIYLSALSVLFIVGSGLVSIPSLIIAVYSQGVGNINDALLIPMYTTSIVIETIISIIVCYGSNRLRRAVSKMLISIYACISCSCLKRR
ncbi:uncharacterized protein LOC143453532 [Clavelina lepadiformis]|uniref:Transmembrane protein n=1 Tax=Clavelina lepadiformis TaxID=159417 RepID=A0ABP0H399_CLALP